MSDKDIMTGYVKSLLSSPADNSDLTWHQQTKDLIVLPVMHCDKCWYLSIDSIGKITGREEQIQLISLSSDESLKNLHHMFQYIIRIPNTTLGLPCEMIMKVQRLPANRLYLYGKSSRDFINAKLVDNNGNIVNQDIINLKNYVVGRVVELEFHL